MNSDHSELYVKVSSQLHLFSGRVVVKFNKKKKKNKKITRLPSI